VLSSRDATEEVARRTGARSEPLGGGFRIARAADGDGGQRRRITKKS
jgi:hypothetical protein